MKENGFTLLEVLVVLALFSVLVFLTVTVSISSMRSRALSNERNLLVGLLQKARADSMANIGALPHGVYIDGTNYVVFTGSAYNPTSTTNETYPVDTSIQNLSTLPTSVVFRQLSATTTSASITLKDSTSPKQSQIDVSTEGQITWTN